MDNIVRAYYKFRKYVMPNPYQALLFLLSEVGEIVEAFLDTKPELKIPERRYLSNMVKLLSQADIMVSDQDAWVRNNDRQKKERDVADEIGDANMMLRVFAMSLGINADNAMITKMEKKGFIE